MRVSRWSFALAAATLGAVGGTAALAAAPSAGAPVPITVYKSPTCGCCAKWVDHMKAAGFEPTVRELDDLSEIKAGAGVPGELESCHTAIVGGYTIEGHVPAADVQRLLKEKPKVAGLSAPGMPMGSPGMEGPRKDAYDVVTFDRAGRTTVFAKH